MRKIKFRGKNKDGVWHYGGYVEYLGKPRIVNSTLRRASYERRS